MAVVGPCVCTAAGGGLGLAGLRGGGRGGCPEAGTAAAAPRGGLPLAHGAGCRAARGVRSLRTWSRLGAVGGVWRVGVWAVGGSRVVLGSVRAASRRRRAPEGRPPARWGRIYGFLRHLDPRAAAGRAQGPWRARIRAPGAPRARQRPRAGLFALARAVCRYVLQAW
jgi:hypothetical protein